MVRSFRLALTVSAWLAPAMLVLSAIPARSADLVQLEVHRDGVNGVDGLDGAEGLAISPDGTSLYAVSSIDGAVAVFSRNTSGALTFVEAERDGMNGVEGLGGAQAVAVSPDGAHVYVASSGTATNPGSDDAVAIFTRDTLGGALTFVAAVRDNENGFNGLNGGAALAISGDGLFVYVASEADHAVAILSRDPVTGLLTFVGEMRDGENGLDGVHAARALALSPGDAHLYVSGAEDDAVVVFSRDSVTGLLTFVEMEQDGVADVDGLARTRSVAVSPDGAHVYAGGRSDDALAIFARDAGSGALSFLGLVKDDVNGVNGLDGVHALALSADGAHLYAAGDRDNTLALFDRDAGTGALTFVQVRKDGSGGVTGLAEASAVVLSPDGAVYAAGFADDAVTVFLSQCGNGVAEAGEQCDDGNNAAGDCCSPTCGFDAPATACGSDNNVCTDDVCDGGGLCEHLNNTAPCSDGLFCTVNDVCGGGTCAGEARDCSGAADQCNDGICDEAKDRCTQPKPNGLACNDGNACTQTDKCKSGACVGSNPVSCSAPDQCHDATCDPATGTCGSQPKTNGSACNDGNACTQSDACMAGGCVGSNPVVCTALDQCHLPGTCDTATGQCSQPAKANGAACNDGNGCTQTDTCTAGTCGGSNPVVCSALDQCHTAGTCDPSNGQCSNPAKADGTPCDDGQQCTVEDACVAGTCTPAEPAGDADADGVCDVLDICGMYDPDQLDADGDGVGDACECTAPAPGRCLPGGGNKKTDCLVEFNTSGPVALNRKGTMVLGTLRCDDGDPRCDRDGQANGQCTFGVTVCLQNRDPRFPRCGETEVTHLEVLSPNPDKTKSSMDKDNGLALERAVNRLGVEIVRKGHIVSQAASTTDGSCTDLLELVVPAGNGSRPTSRVFKIRGDGADSRRDIDRLTLECK